VNERGGAGADVGCLDVSGGNAFDLLVFGCEGVVLRCVIWGVSVFLVEVAIFNCE